MEDFKTINAIIRSVSINDGDRGLLTAYLNLDHEHGSQGFGGYSLYLPTDYKHHQINLGYAGHFIFRCMQIGDVTAWEKLAGKTIRIKYSHSKIEAIGHIVKDDWFNPSIDFKNEG